MQEKQSNRSGKRRKTRTSSRMIESLEGRVLLAANAIVQENLLTGTPKSTWDITGAGDTTLQGFATDISVNAGSAVNFKVDDTGLGSYHISIYRLGYYQGNGARLVATIATANTIEKQQPAPILNTSVGLLDCGNWTVSASWSVPSTAVSGVYIADLVRDTNGAKSQIPFIVRNDSSHSNIVFKTSDTTWQAYNDYGGKSLYDYQSAGDVRAAKVSYNRPFNTRADSGGDYLFSAEFPMIRWIEQNGYDVSYISSIDADRSGALLKNHKIFMSVGHDEYWSGGERANVEAARDAGVNLAFFSGNEVLWKTRWENSVDGSNTGYRTLVCYKESIEGLKSDPSTQWTGIWADPRYSPPSDGGNPSNALTGQVPTINGGASGAIKVPSADGKMRFWRNTTVATLGSSATATLSPNTLGYEWDESPDNLFRPAGMINLSTTTVSNAPVMQGYGVTYVNATATHHMTLYKAASGAIVFGAGVVQWSWGLDNTHDTAEGTSSVDVRMQQATVNLFADMGVQPGSLQSNLVAATASTDFTPPVAVITSPKSNSSINSGKSFTITGTATDVGGVVGMVEVSTDGGMTWHPATGRGSWSYSWVPAMGGAATIKVRAVDDSLNKQATPASVTVNVTGASGQSVFGDAVPTFPSEPDSSAVELGMRFRADVAGKITGVRFYKGSGNTGTHIGNLWSNTGTKLASVTFSSEGTSGWQTATFATTVSITANTTYVVSYFAPAGHYSDDDGYFTGKGAGTQQVRALQDNIDGDNGVYRYASSSGFPNSPSFSANYYVDVLFQPNVTDTTPPTVTAKSPASGATGVATTASMTATFSEAINAGTLSFAVKNASTNAAVTGSVVYDSSTMTATFTPTASLSGGTTYTATVSASDLSGNPMSSPLSWSFTTAADLTPPAVSATSPASGATGVAIGSVITATFNESVQSASIVFTLANGGNVAGTVSYNSSTRTATFTPSGALKNSTVYTASVRATDLAGNAMTAATTWAFTTAAAAAAPISIWSSSTVPVHADEPDPSAVELGMKFSSDVAGTITAIRFYKSTNNTGTHIGSLWDASGTKLASATFTSESASGWQQVNFATPVSIAAGTVYVASYFAPKGNYAEDDNYFASSSADNGPLHALQDATAGGNGVFHYGSASAFPDMSYSAANYWVDVVFQAGAPAGAMTTLALTSSTSSKGSTSTLSTSTSASSKKKSVSSLVDQVNATGKVVKATAGKTASAPAPAKHVKHPKHHKHTLH